MKKAVGFVLAFGLVLTMAGCSQDTNTGSWDWESEPAAESTGVTLNVYNWGEYIDDSEVNVNDAFTHLTGIEVNYKNFTDNESMYALLSSGAADYDVIFPSDYMVGKMIRENMLAKINFENVPTSSISTRA